MKSLSLLCLLIPFVFSFTSSTEKDPVNSKELLLQNAVDQKKVQTVITSNGGHDISSVHLKIINLTSAALQITIPNGTVFIPADADDQDLLLIEDEKIVLQPKQSKEMDLDAYCMESSDSSPQVDGKMSFKTVHPTSNLKLLCTQLNNGKLRPDDIQSAVWAVSDGEPLAHISMNTPSAANLRETVSELTGQENSWYTVHVNRRTDENRRIETSSAAISGKLKIHLTAPAMVHEEVVDADGNVKFTMKKANFPKAGEWNYSFNLRVMGWKKGEYKVLVFQNDVKINEFPFSV